METIKSVVCFFAHPDDEVFACGGTIARFAKQGAKIYAVCATDGRQGGRDFAQNLSTSQMKNLRNKEITHSAKILGVLKLICWHYHDKKLARASKQNIEKRIISTLNRYRPDLVITFGRGGVTGHSDHKAISEFTSNSFKKWKHKTRLWHARMERVVEKKFKHRDTLSKGVNITVSIKGFGGTKLRAIHAHKSQVFTRARVGSKGQNAAKQFFHQETFAQIYPQIRRSIYY